MMSGPLRQLVTPVREDRKLRPTTQSARRALAAVATNLMATSGNVSRIESGQVTLPDMVAAAQLQKILLAAYTSDEDGFVKTLVDEQNPCPTSPSCNVALDTMLTTGGPNRGLANSALTITYGSADGGINVYTVERGVFDAQVTDWITTGDQKEAVLAVFRANLGIPDSATEAEQLTAIENYIWTNVERMRALNPYVPGATNREVMPQASPLTPILALMGSGLLSYSFPTISYLG